jgi:hypothetical protein
MKNYIGTKAVNAMPMTRASYNAMRGWTLPADENGDDDGYLVEYTDGGKPNHKDFEGYISWSPKEQFEAAYRESTGLTFGMALEALKLGMKVARIGWNGKGMWLSMSGPVGGRLIQASSFWSSNNADFADTNGGAALVLPCITMKTATGEILMGWLASQSDMLSTDWQIVE